MTDLVLPRARSRALCAPWRAATLLAMGVLAIGCKTQIDSNKAEKVIGDKLAEHGFVATVTCPDHQQAKTGAVFDCEASTADGTKVTIVVTQKDNEGNVTWKPDGTIVDTDKIVADAKAKIGGSAAITCPKRAVVLKQAGETTSCTVKDGDKQGRLEIKLEKPETGGLTWEIKPA
jgi:hypothetical protein